MTKQPTPTRVLLVEDNPGDAYLFCWALARVALGKFEVETVSTLALAVQHAAGGSTDVVVLDLTLPDSFGMETLETMRRAAPSTPIVVLTGEEDERVGLEALTKGAEDYLVKGDNAGRTIARSLLFAVERRLFKEQLNRRDALLAEAQRIAGLGSFEWDVAADRFEWSDELCRIYGVEGGRTSSTAEGFLAHVIPEDRERVHQLLQDVLDSGKEFDFEYRIMCLETMRTIHSRGHVLVTGPGQPKRVAGTCQDITERRKLEGSLVLAGRMSSVGTLASGIAHELNNPLTCVMSSLEFVGQELQELEGVIPPGRIRELTESVEQASHAAERVRLIVKGIKTFSRTDVEEKREPVELKAVMELAIHLTLNEIRSRARLVEDYGPTPFVDADEARLSQVFVNLLMNAVQAIGDGARDENEIRVVTSTDAAGRAVLEIHDTGCGIPEANRSQVFDPFFTTKPVGVGTGLGLSISHAIVTGHGGEITFENSRGGKGTTFRVVLPAGRSRVLPAQLSVRPPPPVAAGRRGCVLIVDDEAIVANALSRVLSRDHNVVVARNGREAMDRFDRGERFDVVLCDLMMPVMSGIGLFEQLLRVIPDQAEKIVFVTGGAFTPTAKSFLDRVASPRIEKPFESASIRALVRSFVKE
jgi:signal transduction histidine kinase